MRDHTSGGCTEAADPKQRRPRSVVWLLALIAGVSGFYCARWVWPGPSSLVDAVGPGTTSDRDMANGSESGTAAVLARQSGSRDQASFDFAPGLPDPASPVPESPAMLFEEASRALDALVETFSFLADAWETKARLVHWFGKSKQAVELWEECLRLDPNYAHALVGLGMVAAAQEDHPTAVKRLRQALALQPGHFPARAALANTLIAMNQPNEVVALLEDYLRRDPRSQGFFLLGQAHVQLGQFEKARDAFEAATEKYPDYGEAYYRLATVYARLGQQDKAKQALEKSRALKADQRHDERVQRSQYGDLDAVRARVAESYNEAASIYFARNRHREAERLWRRGAKLAPNNVECRQGLAWLCWQQVRVPESIEFLKQLAALQPKDAAIWFEIGRMHSELLEFAEAAAAFDQAIAIEPGNEKYRQARESAKQQAEQRRKTK